MVPDHVFREYDIRGIAETELTDDVTRLIGRAFASKLAEEGKRTIAVGRDMRISSDRIFKALVEGLTASGAEVTDLGLVPTPLLYFSVTHFRLDAGISITGSHNPGEYNGFKLHLADRPFFGSEIQGLRERIAKRNFVEGTGTVRPRDILAPYQDYVTGLFSFKRKLKVVVDSGHGMGGIVAPALFRRLGLDVIELYSDLNPDFPDHHPDPSVPSNLADLQKKVLETGADLGVGFDGDADRIGVVDEKGTIIYGDKLLLLYARSILKRKPGATIIGDVKCSQIVYDDIAAHGGKPLMWKTGHSLIKAKMKETKAELAGEMSGHVFFMDGWFGFDDAIYAACRVFQILDETQGGLSLLLADVPELVSTPELRTDCPDDLKFRLVAMAVEAFKKDYKVVDIDGARVLFDDGWGLVRASNTGPVLVMRFEATSLEKLNAIRKIVEDKIKELSGQLAGTS